MIKAGGIIDGRLITTPDVGRSVEFGPAFNGAQVPMTADDLPACYLDKVEFWHGDTMVGWLKVGRNVEQGDNFRVIIGPPLTSVFLSIAMTEFGFDG